VVDHHIDRLVAGLGPRDRTTGDLTDELRDGLLASAERIAATGVTDIAAAQAALREFGDVGRLTPAMSADVTATRAHAAARAILRSGPLAAALWTAVIIAGPASVWHAGTSRPQGVVPVLGLGVLFTIACTLTAYRAACGTGSRSTRIAHGAAVAGVTGCALTDLAGLTLIASWLTTMTTAHGAITWLTVAGAATVSCGRMLLMSSRLRHLWTPPA
jgi:uncharacterized membrane protein